MSQAVIIRSPGTLSNPSGPRILPALPVEPILRFHADLHASIADNTPLASIDCYGRPDKSAVVSGDVRASSIDGNKTLLFAAAAGALAPNINCGKNRTIAVLAHFTGAPTSTSQILRTVSPGTVAIAVQPIRAAVAYGTGSPLVESPVFTLAGWHAIVAVFRDNGTADLILDGAIHTGPIAYAGDFMTAQFRMQAASLPSISFRQALLVDAAINNATALALSTALLADRK